MQSTQCSPPPASPLRRAAIIAALVALGSCSSDGNIDSSIPNILIIVNVQGVLSDVMSLEVRASLNGKSDPTGLNIASNLSQFAITLPNTPASLGTLRVDAYGLDANKCYKTSGSVSTQIKAGDVYQELTLSLNPTGMLLCQLVVDVTGDGAVTSSPLGINCGGNNTVCSFGFPLGTAVTLSGPASLQSYPVWSSGCSPSGGTIPQLSCKLTLAQGEQHVAATFVPRTCSPSGWCQYNPLPTYFGINNMWGSSAKDVWAVGAAPAIMHYDGRAWTVMQSPTLSTLTRVWGSGPKDVWALGSGALLHYDGAMWSTVSGSQLTTFNSVTSTGPSDVWVSGDTGQVAHFDGSQWTRAFTATEAWNSMWAASPTDIWGIGTSGAVFHYQNGTAQKDTSPVLSGKILTSLWGTSSTNVWVASGSEAFHFDGTAWAAQPADSFVTLSGIGGIGGFGGPDAWFAATSGRIFHNQGTAACLTKSDCWSQANTGTLNASLRAVWGSSATDIWAAGDFNGLMHYDGQQWKLDPSVAGTSGNMFGVWTTPVTIVNNPAVYAFGSSNLVLSSDGLTASTSTVNLGGSTMSAIFGVTSGSAIEMWTVGSGGAVFRTTDAKTWSALSPASPGSHLLQGVWMTTTNNPRYYVVVGDTGFIGRFDSMSNTWMTVTGCGTANLRAVHGQDGGNLIAVGAGGAIYTISGANTATPMCASTITGAPGATYTGVFYDGISAWLSTDTGTVTKYSPGTQKLTAFTVPGAPANLTGIWSGGGGKNPSIVIAVGTAGTVLSCDPTALTCTQQATGLTTALRSVWGANPSDIWAAGDRGVLLRWKM